MDKYVGFGLKVLRKIYAASFGLNTFTKPDCEQDPDLISELIYEQLTGYSPCMIARFGSTEMACLSNHVGMKYHQDRYLDYIKGETEQWWWNKNIMNQMQEWSGFFPPTHEKLEEFCELMYRDIPLVDILGSWLPNERYFEDTLGEHTKVRLIHLDPFWAEKPWTRALEGKKVLVIHPFVKTMEKQYRKRDLLHKKNILPEFELKTMEAVQSIAGNETGFSDWFEALNHMKDKMSGNDYDICIIGAGAYGFPLAAHAKRMGKKGFHLGGSLQLLFGIKGNRWENPNYKSELGLNYLSLFNEHWVRPTDKERPKRAEMVENATYW